MHLEHKHVTSVDLFQLTFAHVDVLNCSKIAPLRIVALKHRVDARATSDRVGGLAVPATAAHRVEHLKAHEGEHAKEHRHERLFDLQTVQRDRAGTDDADPE